MFDDMRGGRPYHWYPDPEYWAAPNDTQRPKKEPKAPEPPKQPSAWRRAAREIGVCLGIATAIGLPLYAAADWWYHKDLGKPQHGGQVHMTEQNHVELVARPDRMTVYVTDHEGRPSNLTDTVVTIAVGNGSSARPMLPVSGNSLELRGQFTLNKDTMVMVTVDKSCEQPLTAVFTPMTPEPPLPAGLICTTPKPVPAACRVQRNNL